MRLRQLVSFLKKSKIQSPNKIPPRSSHSSIRRTNLLIFLSASNEALLEKYGLKANDAILAEEKHMGLYDDLLENYEAKLIAGGAAQNTARGAQVNIPSLPSSIFPIPILPLPYLHKTSDPSCSAPFYSKRKS